ncbi:unnamed protein product [Lepeophtheirus salmonis]|uniref:(salmon louse) hypothetical protein n=1 Tax=Lepeophtheirus salmonis TaxID=72036 RepID=A0A7R8CBM8_LEPSM|nr:unnamed protein product [Lepeophtheirus salmonis]CAF2760718.1 unnamed protein product [Lepeophtheirus salmonis]
MASDNLEQIISLHTEEEEENNSPEEKEPSIEEEGEMCPIEFAKKSGFIASNATSSKVENKIDLTRENLQKQFFLVCDSLGEDVTALEASHDHDNVWSGSYV